MQRHPRKKDEVHLDFIRQLPCIICGNNIETEAAHIRMADPSIAKPGTGIGQKPHDMFALPLCGVHHREQHAESEKKWWNSKRIDPFKIALALYAESGDFERGIEILNDALL